MTRNQWKVIGVSHYYPYQDPVSTHTQQLVALDRVTFTQSFGQIVGIIGGKGAGKSTLGRILTGTLTPSEGLVSGRGEQGGTLKLPDRRQEDRTGEAYVRYYLLKWGIAKKKLPALIEAIHLFSELRDLFSRRIRTYSREEKSQLAVSLLLHAAPTVIYMDESLLMVKEDFYIKVFLFLAQLKELGSSILIETETVKRIEAYCDQLVWLEFGVIQKQGEVLDVLRHYDEYYYRIQRQSLSQQQAFWEEGYQGQVKDSEQVESPKPSVLLIRPKESPVLPVPETDKETSVESPLHPSSPVSRTQLRKQAPRRTYYGAMAGGLLLCLAIGGGILAANRGGLKGSGAQRPQTVPSTSFQQVSQSVQDTSEQSSHPAVSSEAASTGTHRVVDGETLSQLADRYRVSIKELREWNQLTSDELQIDRILAIQAPVNNPPTSSTPPAVASFTHTVAEGDSLVNIADLYGVSEEELRAVNHLDGDLIYTGSALTLPGTAKTPAGQSTEGTSPVPPAASESPVILPETSGNYTVVKGDTLYSIAQRHGVDVMAIQQVNHLQSDQLAPGLTLVIPSNH